MYISSCPSLRDLGSTFTHMRTQEVMHTPSCLCFTEYPHRFIHECTSVYSCADKMHVYFQHFFFFRDSHIHTSTHISVHMCCSRMPTSASTHIPCMQASPSTYAPTNMPFTAAPTSTQSRTCTHTHAYTRFDHRMHSPQHLSTFVLTRHGAWSYDRCVHTCPSEACLYMSIHVPHARVSMLLCTRLNTYLHTLVHHLQVPWRYVRICHLAHIT